eukprot:1171702-Prorocentrum_minimum.AAC.4
MAYLIHCNTINVQAQQALKEPFQTVSYRSDCTPVRIRCDQPPRAKGFHPTRGFASLTLPGPPLACPWAPKRSFPIFIFDFVEREILGTGNTKVRRSWLRGVS